MSRFLGISIGLLERLGFSGTCGRGREIISIDFSGNVSKCSFDDPIIQLQKADDLIEFVKENYPFETTSQCPFV